MNTAITAIRACPICNLSKVINLHQMNFDLPKTSTLPRQYQVVACQNCGMIYADSVASQKDYDLYYEQFSNYEDLKTGSGGGYSLEDKLRLDSMAELISSHLKSSDSVIDIGCANGGLLVALSGLGHKNLIGVDPSLTSIKHVRDRGFNGVSLKISELTRKEIGSYQAVILSHVLEHVFDLSATMEIILSILDEDGFLYIEVPDASRYISHYVVPFHYFDSEHINHFDSAALRNFAGLYGLDVVDEGQKEISVSLAVNYPATYIVLRKQYTYVKYDVQYHDESKSAIEEYVEQSKNDKRLDKIERYVVNQEPLIIWGAGSYTQSLLVNTKLAECNIVTIVDNDNNKHGLEINSIKVESTDVLHQTEGLILISAAIYAEEIKSDIAVMGLMNNVDVLG
jgi:2-polyprenyl-3-methyl-5-hydroxy-6-metoxy-1,4-benzoquinol methylase